MTVYRVENADGKGPYRPWPGGDLAYRLRTHGIGNGRPGVYEPGGPWAHLDCGPDGLHVCGFASKRQLVAWFDREERRLLADAGFTVVVYDVHPSDVLEGTNQLTFSKGNAQRVSP